MGKRNSQRKGAAILDSDDTDSVSSTSTVPSESVQASNAEEILLDKDSVLDQCLDELFEKRGSTREKALASMIDIFNSSLRHEFVEKKFATLLHQCLSCIKRRGSAKEISLASHLIGLLALTTGPGEKAREILEESVPHISEALKSRGEALKMSALLDCLAIITFVGADAPEQTEKSMQIMWQVVHPKLGSNVVAMKPLPILITAVVSAWSFLVTTMDGRSLNSKIWQESMLYFSTLLDKDDRLVRIAAGEALAIIFEMGDLEKFCVVPIKGGGGSSDGAVDQSHDTVAANNIVNGMKQKVENQIKNLSVEAAGKGSSNKKDLNSQRNFFRDILDFVEDGTAPETSMKIGGESLATTSWCHLIQLNFMKRFLGGGFVKHMQENELLHDVFGFTPKKKLGSRLERVSGTEKRLFRSPNSAHSKARTQLLNKQRVQSQDRNAGHYGAAASEE
jgi:hypothetical protein